jgi:hypothetical protein
MIHGLTLDLSSKCELNPSLALPNYTTASRVYNAMSAYSTTAWPFESTEFCQIE